MRFIREYSCIVYLYVTTISFLTPPIYYKLLNAPCADHKSVHKMNPDIHLTYEVPATVNYTEQRAARLTLTDISSQKILRAVCLMSVSVTYKR